MVNFKFIVAKIQQEGFDISETKAKEYFSQLMEAVDVESRLLRKTGKNIEASRFTEYEIPEESVDFVVEMLEMFTSEDFKLIRSARSTEVDLELREEIVLGFYHLLKKTWSGGCINN